MSSPCYTARRKRPVPSSTPLPVITTDYEEVETAGPWAPLGTPVWKPFLNFLETVLRYRMRPVPVTFLRFAFSDQLSVMRPCQRLALGQRLHRSWILRCWKRTLADLSGGVAAPGADLLLVVERPAAGELSMSALQELYCRLVLSPNARVVSLIGSGFVSTYPQRLQRPWVLVWLGRSQNP